MRVNLRGWRCLNNRLRCQGLLRYFRRRLRIARIQTTPRPPGNALHAARDHGQARRPHPPDRIPLRPAGSAWGRTSSACGRRRTAARRSSLIRCASRPSRISSTGSRTRSATSSRAWSCPDETRRVLDATVDLVADMATINPFDFFVEDDADQLAVRLRARCSPASSSPICEPLPGGPAARRATSREIDRSGKPTIDFLIDLNRRLSATSPTASAWSRACRRPRRPWRARSGSCRDTGWLLVQILRRLGLAARFVSGYLIQLRPDVKPLDGPAGPDRRLHRPARLGRGLPPRRRLDRARPDLRPARRRRTHPAGGDARSPSAPPRSPARMATREVDFSSTCRSRACAKPARHHALHAKSSGRRSSRRAPPSTTASTPATCGSRMGGEPTFVVVDDMDGAEWNTAALGPDQARLRRQAGAPPARALRPGGLLHYGQGKWYPGEQPAALGLRHLLAHATASRCGAIQPHRR